MQHANKPKDTQYRKSLLIYPLIIALLFSILAYDAYAAPKKDRTAPSTPTGLQAVTIAETSVSLGWKASTDSSGTIASYRIYTGSTLTGSSAGTSFTAAALKAGQSYTFTVRAVDPSGNVSTASSPLTVKTLAPAPAPEPPPAQVPASKKNIIGYYTGWSTYSGRQIAELDAAKLTHINYAFANIGADLRIALGDSYADVEKVFQGDTATDKFHGNFNQLVKLKAKFPHLRTLISIGGWSWSERFSDVALTDASRTIFADSAIAFIVQYGFDGIDIDWEYPVSGGEADNVKRPEDKQNFTLLMQKLREKLDAQGAKDGRRYLLSMAGAAGTYYTNNVELGKLQQYADFINIMSYDFHGLWDAKTGFNAPLFKDPNSPYAWDTSVSDAVQLYLQAGVPAAKLNMGIPFYGHKYNQVASDNSGLYQSFSGGSDVTYSQAAALLAGQGYTRYWHADAKVPYLFDGSSWISYEDPESIGYKADYAIDQGIAGTMVWSLGMDTSDHRLLQALHDGLQ
jgi:chitinase